MCWVGIEFTTDLLMPYEAAIDFAEVLANSMADWEFLKYYTHPLYSPYSNFFIFEDFYNISLTLLPQKTNHIVGGGGQTRIIIGYFNLKCF